jgi:hypothetical protein
MGLFNVLSVATTCKQCSHSYVDRVQFKHGAVRQYEYSLGDDLYWEPSTNRWASDINLGEPLPGEVLVYGISELEGCSNCGFKNINEYQREHTYFDNEVEYDILLIDNILSSTRPLQDYDVYLVDDGNGGLGFPV